MRAFLRFSALAALLSVPAFAAAQNQNAAQSTQTAQSAPSSSASPSSSQPTSLAEAARKAREEKKATKPPKVFTNDNLPTSGGISSATATGSSTAASSASGNDSDKDASSASAADASSSPKDEKAWREKFAQLHQKLDRDKASLDVMQRELGVLNVQFYNDPTKAMQQDYSREDINKKTAEIEAKKKDIDADQQAISDAEDALQKAGGDPGWAR